MHNMETKRQTESILAKLMGLERPLPIKQLQHSRQRVLSESSLQDIALICQRQKWSFDRYSMDVDNEMLGIEDSSDGLLSCSSSEESLERYRKETDKYPWLLSSFQKAEKYHAPCGANYLQKLLRSPKEMESVSNIPLKSVIQNENIENTHYLQLPSSCSTEGKPKASSGARKKGTCLGKRERGCQRYSREALGHGSMVTQGVAKKVANQLQQSMWHDYLNAFRSVDTIDEAESQNPHVLDSGFVKLDSSPGNMNTSNSKVGHAQCISNSTSSHSTGNSKCRSMNFNVHKHWCLNLVNVGSSYCNSLKDVKSQEDLSARNSTPIASLVSENYVSCEETPLIRSDLNEFVEKDSSRENSSVPVSSEETCTDIVSIANKEIERVLDELPDMLQEIGSSKDIECIKLDALAEQGLDHTLTPLHESDNGSPLYLSEAYKMHPEAVSKLEDIHGSETKLQQPIAEFLVAKDAEEGPENDNGEDIISGTYKTQETQVLSYLVDVLAELGLQSGNMEMCYKLRQPLESLVNPFVFGTLEKKYRKQSSWPKSERKLLFDRVKCGLSDILHPYMGISSWFQHRRKRLVLQYNQETIKEELLAALVNQEKKARKESSKKMGGIDTNWQELEEDMQIVVKEIEGILVDELVEEILSSEL